MLLSFSQTLGIRNKNDITVRWSNESKPSLGGVAFFVAFLLGAIAYSIIFYAENIFHNKEFVGLFGAGLIAFIMGLADDAYNTKPYLKLAVQILCGVILVATDSLIAITPSFTINAFLTISWVVLIMNSLNMLDNMDGITGTNALFILSTCLASDIILYDWNMNLWTLTLCIQIGAIVGFLYYNIHPSKLFMGDAGSQFIGLFTAFFAIHDLSNIGVKTNESPLIGLIIILIAFGPTLVDTLSVVINRLKKGQNPMVGGKDHTTHHLVYAGYSDRQVWYIFLLLSIISLIVSIIAIYAAKWNMIGLVYGLTIYVVAIFIFLYEKTIRFQQKK
ncbi:MAG: undecaprenyl/decaprenyl-phosphate alpha-N-acetylglucosaminyl 1-phosphate transferase [Fluviicola sp.]|nr:undecaprenyl/decaprenyl-phosphate alpha-N-acetylglucosaminyl 1-phosphate transferase [Fluviicola sp.]MBP6270908.1 undecaprenyl/decaprenyl-phosphate alpha-N-acetylglucosaminyl 1-phosphate transferase [Fluviicola sp.]